MKFPRRRFLHLAAGAAALPFAPHVARAQAYPSRPVRILVGLAAGGAIDAQARLIAQWLSDRLGQPFIVENRPGAGSNIATEAVVKAEPDGYTLLFFGPSSPISALLRQPPLDFVRGIAPVASFSREPQVVLINPSVPANTVPEFIAYAKARPGKLNMASAGTGTITHTSGELFNMMAGVILTHVPYRGSAPAITDLIAGRVDMTIATAATSMEFVRAGKLRVLAVTTATRLPNLPDVPPAADFLPGYESSLWNGLGAPQGTSSEIVDTLNREINAALADPKIKARLADTGGIPMAGPPAEFGKLIADETEKWAKVIRAANIKAE
jgi:tripartite-type tricarboxylate transporter receptor subunit TctC